MCLDLDDSNLKTIDHVESDFSDFSDDADDILNAVGFSAVSLKI